jgi:hypothetical protein
LEVEDECVVTCGDKRTDSRVVALGITVVIRSVAVLVPGGRDGPLYRNDHLDGYL